MNNSFEIIEEVKKRFPEFKFTSDMDGLPTVIFAFLVIDLEQAIMIKEDNKVENFVDFVNELVSKENDIISSCLAEIILGLYGHEESYNFFVSKLSTEAKNRFQSEIDIWNFQNNLED